MCAVVQERLSAAQGWSNRGESQANVIIDDGTDAAVNAKDFLNDNKRRMRQSARFGKICAEMVTNGSR